MAASAPTTCASNESKLHRRFTFFRWPAQQQCLESPRDFRDADEDGIVIERREVRRSSATPATLRQSTSLDD